MALGTNDAVDKNSRAFAAGAVAGQVVGELVSNLTPCGQAMKLRYAIKALHAAQAAGNTVGAANAGPARINFPMISGDFLQNTSICARNADVISPKPQFFSQINTRWPCLNA